uniref:DAGKc domain-containing protein n=2 Tax=Kalanchoe fedtschenkoi TaxID=63787 RepID=A0A7N0RBV7_KALFE
MQKIESLSRNNSRSLKVASPQQSLRRLGLCSQIASATGQHSSPVVFPEKRGKLKGSRESAVGEGQQQDKGNRKDEHRIDIGGDEKANLLGYIVFSGKLSLTKKLIKSSTDVSQVSTKETKQESGVDAKLTSKALLWATHRLALDDVISVTYNVGVKHFTVHAYPLSKGSCGLSCFMKARRIRKDFCFLASSSEEALQWVMGFADQQCFINCLPHPLASAKKQASSELIIVDTPIELHLKCKSPPKLLVILNPRSGRGRSTKVFHNLVEPIFKLAGFRMEIVKTTSAGHAK